MKKLNTFLIIFHFAACGQVLAQKEVRVNDVEAGFAASSSFTYTGINSYLLLDAQFNRHDIYAGPKLIVSDSYFPYKSILGYDVGYNFTFLSNGRLSAILNLDYQSSYYKIYNPLQLDINNKRNSINELFLSLGVRYRLSRKSRFSVGLNMGTGAFFEKYYDVVEGTRNLNSGFSQIARVGLHYNLYRR